MLRQTYVLMSAALITAAAVLFTGCNRSAPAPAETAKPEVPAKTASPTVAATEHAHRSGDHGGNIVAIGQDSYHAEAVFETGGKLRLYLLGNDESKLQEIAAQPVKAFVKAAGGQRSEPISFEAEPQAGDAAGKTSQLVAQLPAELSSQSVEVAIPSLTVAGQRFRVSFASAVAPHAETPMPDKVSDAEERDLYLTPGGKYTAADIKANGNVTAPQKFKGQMAAHDLTPHAGDKICPITLTKANPKFTWVVGGESYQFCCPPCVDEFVKLAKQQPEEVKQPGDYIKQ